MALLFQVLHFRVTGGGYAQAQKIPVKMCKLLKTIARNNRLQLYITFSVICKYPRAQSKPSKIVSDSFCLFGTISMHSILDIMVIVVMLLIVVVMVKMVILMMVVSLSAPV